MIKLLPVISFCLIKISSISVAFQVFVSMLAVSAACQLIARRHPLLLGSSFHSSRQCPAMSSNKSLSEWTFSTPNQLAASLPIDPIEKNHVRWVSKCIFSRVRPEPLTKDLQLAAVSQDALTGLLDMDPNVQEDPLFIKFAAGNELLPGSEPLAHRYGGFQFGYWADQLGDGRAILLGEYINRWVAVFSFKCVSLF